MGWAGWEGGWIVTGGRQGKCELVGGLVWREWWDRAGRPKPDPNPHSWPGRPSPDVSNFIGANPSCPNGVSAVQHGARGATSIPMHFFFTILKMYSAGFWHVLHLYRKNTHPAALLSFFSFQNSKSISS